MENARSMLEFPHKSQSKRMQMFRTRAKKSVRALANSFYKRENIEISEAKIDAIADEIVEDLIDLVVEKPNFLSKELHPEVGDQKALLDKLVKDVVAVAGDKLPLHHFEEKPQLQEMTAKNAAESKR
jgi:ribosomal protein L17